MRQGIVLLAELSVLRVGVQRMLYEIKGKAGEALGLRSTALAAKLGSCL
jgi:hypothetical protein